MARKRTTIIESSSEESASEDRLKRTRVRSTAPLTRKAPSRSGIKPPPAPLTRNASLTPGTKIPPTPVPNTTTARNAVGATAGVSAVAKAKTSSPKKMTKQRALEETSKSKAAAKPTKSHLIKDQIEVVAPVQGNEIGSVDNGGHDGHEQGIAQCQENRMAPQWVYPNLLDGTGIEDGKSQGYILEHMLRAHSRSTHDGQDDNETNTWATAFQPTLPVHRSYAQQHFKNDIMEATTTSTSMKEGDKDDNDSDDDEEMRKIKERKRFLAKEMSRQHIKSSSIVATCGGNTVCLIDCRMGRVVAKYSHQEEEEFMCLAWTTLDHHENEDNDEDEGWMDIRGHNASEDRFQQTNILAVAGRMGSIKLINPLQNICYKYLHGHKDSIVQLKFSLTNPRWLFSASMDGTARLWDIGSLSGYSTEARCLAEFTGMDDSSVTAIGVSEKYLIAGTVKGLMAQYDLFDLARVIEKNPPLENKETIRSVKPERIYPPSQEWHESSLDDIVYIPYFSEKSYTALKSERAGKDRNSDSGKTSTKDKAKSKGVRGRGRNMSIDNEDGEFVFASREDSQGEIIVWDASSSTKTDAALKTILEWQIAESWTKITLAENILSAPRTCSTKQVGNAKAKTLTEQRQNVLVVGTTDGKIALYDLGRKPVRAKDGNIIAEKPDKTISHAESTELFRDVAVSQDLSMIVAADWTNRVLIWNYRESTTHA
ncbi:Leucine-rich repeats and WD repeat domain-containing protein 1 [Haplosporangium sp. Z 11]|nr:Leucine-rich repeats and WD repeat domain-containing protein 1 [Haplosporangium sp. Z 11]